MGSTRSGKPRYTATVHAKIVAALRLGAYKLHAARAAGVSVKSLEKWLAKGRKGVRRYKQFAIEVDQVMSEHANRMQGAITKAALTGHAGDWKAAAWDLERRFPHLYGRKPEAAVGVSFGGGSAADGGDEQPRTTVQFYIPDNGRRPIEET